MKAHSERVCRSRNHFSLSLEIERSESKMDAESSSEQASLEISEETETIKITSPKPLSTDGIPASWNLYDKFNSGISDDRGAIVRTEDVSGAADTACAVKSRDKVQSSKSDPCTGLRMAGDSDTRSAGADSAQGGVTNEDSLDIVRKMSEVKIDTLQWRNAGSYVELKQQQCRRLYAESGRADDVALFFHNGSFRAMEAWCSHMGGPLYEGDIEDYNGRSHVMCPWHSYMFDLVTGKNEIGLEQKLYELKYEFGKIYIRHRSELSLDPGSRRDSVSKSIKPSDTTVIDVGKKRNVSVLEAPIHLTP